MATRHERLLGFDLRVSSPDWSAERRSAYLLRQDVAQPFSTDSTVWPSLFDDDSHSRPSWVGPFQDLWENLDDLREHLAAPAGSARGYLVAVTVHAGDEARLASFLDLHRGYDPRSGESVVLPFMRPGARDERWPLLGYDVSDVWALSGLSNCGYDAGEIAGLRAAWGPRLNQHHLFTGVDDADAFRQLSDRRVVEHAPFFVFGLWSIS